MELFGIQIEVRNQPPLDADYIPMHRFHDAYLQQAHVPVGLALERPGGVAVVETYVRGGADNAPADCYHLDRLVKTLLWQKGGFRLCVRGPQGLCDYLQATYALGGARHFDCEFMQTVYGRPFAVCRCTAAEFPAARESAQAVGGHLDGCRIGFDAGGSDRKVSAVVDGETVYSEEVVWYPKTTSDWRYHYDGIVEAMKTAASHMPRVDAIGVSSAGVFVENETKVASLFLKIPPDEFRDHVRTIFTDAAREVADVPCVVCNDGDVSALAGGLSLGRSNVLGIAMGTSEAVGFLDRDGHITGWLNELAFAPVDASPAAERDEWSGDIGVGCKYFSQDAVIKLARNTAIELPDTLSPAQKLKVVQQRLEAGDAQAVAIYESIGVYLGHTLAMYHEMYGFCDALLMGRVMSGRGGDLVLARALTVLQEEYPDIAARIRPQLPSEEARRVGQSVAAASLPAL